MPFTLTEQELDLLRQSATFRQIIAYFLGQQDAVDRFGWLNENLFLDGSHLLVNGRKISVDPPQHRASRNKRLLGVHKFTLYVVS